jgi:hypothetical protein
MVKADRRRYHEFTQQAKGAQMSEVYEAPEITVLGELTDMTQATTKPGVYFDFGNCNQGSNVTGSH